MEEAIKKINEEMQKDPNNTYMEIIGHYLIDRAAVEPMVAAAINKPERTLKGAMGEILKVAQKKKKGNVAVLLPSEVFDTIDKYFVIAPDNAARFKAMGVDEKMTPGMAASASAPAASDLRVLPGGKAKKSKIDIDLDDFF